MVIVIIKVILEKGWGLGPWGFQVVTYALCS